MKKILLVSLLFAQAALPAWAVQPPANQLGDGPAAAPPGLKQELKSIQARLEAIQADLESIRMRLPETSEHN